MSDRALAFCLLLAGLASSCLVPSAGREPVVNAPLDGTEVWSTTVEPSAEPSAQPSGERSGRPGSHLALRSELTRTQ